MSKPCLIEKEGQEELAIPPLKIAVEGCGHGSLDTIYEALAKTCEARGWTLADLDFLIICGDFQAVRNERDLNCMSVPRRYRHMGDFHRYYSGESRAPVLTLVIGGNHEASNYFSELYLGGWLAPSIYYLGAANVVRYGPYRIAGLSGIFGAAAYHRPHHERRPYNRDEVRSAFHVREGDVSRLLRVRRPVDICLSHDWPRRVEWFGDHRRLFADRPHFFESATIDNLGSPPAEHLLSFLRPRYWFSGHMHVRYTAEVQHEGRKVASDIFKNLAVPDDVRSKLPKSMFRAANLKKSKAVAPKTIPPDITNTVTHFLALDKPGPDREFLELLEINPPTGLGDTRTAPYTHKTPQGKFALHYDEEWLSIVRSTGDAEDEALDLVLGIYDAVDSNTPSQDLQWIQSNVTAKGRLKIPDKFEIHAPIYDPNDRLDADEQPCEYPNSQTAEFCQMLQIRNRFAVGEEMEEVGHDIVFE